MRSLSLRLAPLAAAVWLNFTPAYAWIAQGGSSTPTVQQFLGGSTGALAAGGDRFLPAAYVASTSTTAFRSFVFPFAGTITDFKSHSKTALTGGGKYTVTIQISSGGGAFSSTAATCELTSSVQTCTWTGSVSVASGDVAVVLYHPSSGPAPSANPIATHAWKFTPATPNNTILPGAAIAGTFSNSGSTQGVVPTSSGSPASISANSRRHWRVPDSGTIDTFYIDSSAPGGTASYTYTVDKNGSTQALTQIITGSATSGSDTNSGHAFSVAAGDDIEFQGVASGSPTASTAAFATRFLPSTAGHYAYGVSATQSGDSATVVQYYPPNGGPVGVFTDPEVQTISYAHTVKAIYCKVSTAPGGAGSGKSRTFTLLIGGAPTAATCTINEAATTAQVTGLSVAIADNDFLSVKDDPGAGSPSSTTFSVTFLATQ